MELSPLVLIIALPFMAGLAAVLLPSDSRAPATWLAGATTLACLALTISLYPSVSGGGSVQQRFEWIPSLGLDFTLRMDGFAWLFAFLVTGSAFSSSSIPGTTSRPKIRSARFYSFSWRSRGRCWASFFPETSSCWSVFWELTSIFSFLLIGYWHHNQAARDGARMASDDNRDRRPGLAGRRARHRPHRRQL